MNGMSASATRKPSAFPAARAAHARLAPMPSSASSHTTISASSLPKIFSFPGRTTATTRGTTSFRWRSDCTAMGTPCGRLCWSLSEPKRFAEPAASSSPTMFKTAF
jgi:hypothetical protein